MTKLPPLALQLLGTGNAVFDVHLDSGEIIEGILQLAKEGLPGDYNQNGVVDGADYVIWRNNDRTPQGYNTWRAQFGQTAGGGSTLPSAGPLSAAVPEPAALVLLFLTAAGISHRRRSKALPVSKLVRA